MTSKKLRELTKKLNDWCQAEGIKADSVDSVLCDDTLDLTQEQQDWLRDFVYDWDEEEAWQRNEGLES